MGEPPPQVWEAHKHLNEGIASGEVHPLPWTVYSRDRAQEAFRYLAGGGHTSRQPFCHPRIYKTQLSCTPSALWQQVR